MGFLLALPEANRVKQDPGALAALEREARSVFVLLVDDRHVLMFVSLTVAVDADFDLSQLVFDHQIDPLIERHLRTGFRKRGPIRQFDPVTSSFQNAEADHVVADLETGPTGREFRFFELVAQVADKLFRDFAEMPYRFHAQDDDRV